MKRRIRDFAWLWVVVLPSPALAEEPGVERARTLLRVFLDGKYEAFVAEGDDAMKKGLRLAPSSARKNGRGRPPGRDIGLPLWTAGAMDRRRLACSLGHGPQARWTAGALACFVGRGGSDATGHSGGYSPKFPRNRLRSTSEICSSPVRSPRYQSGKSMTASVPS